MCSQSLGCFVAPFFLVILFLGQRSPKQKAQPLVRIGEGGQAHPSSPGSPTPRGCGPFGTPLIHSRGIISGKHAWPKFLREKRVIFDSWIEKPLCCHCGAGGALPSPEPKSLPTTPGEFFGGLSLDGGLGKDEPWFCQFLCRDFDFERLCRKF